MGKKRGKYKRRFHKPLVDIGDLKTTSDKGKRRYMKEYMRRYRNLDRGLKKLEKDFV